MSIFLVGSPANPQFWTDYRISYAWFLDAASTRVSTLGPVTVSQHWRTDVHAWGPAAGPDGTPESAGLIGFLFFGGAAFSGLGSIDVVKFTGMTVGADSVDLTEITGNWSHQGVGSVNVVGPGDANFAAYSYHFSYDLDITKFGAGTTGAHVFDTYENVVQLHSDGTQKSPQSDFLTCPITNSYTVPITGWETHQKVFGGSLRFDVTPAWAATNPDIPLDPTDLKVPIWANPALSDPASAGEVYKPLTINLPTVLPVESTRTSSWVSSDTMKGTVSNASVGAAVFHVSDPSVSYSRRFNQTWRTWTSPPFPIGIDAYEFTKHAVGDDVWGWESYGWLQAFCTSVAAWDAKLTITGVYLEVDDPHTTGSDRADGYSQTEHPFSYDYTLSLINGANTTFIDLLFPNAGGTNPVYVARVDQLTLSALPVGDTTLTDLKLAAREHGYLKVDYGPPVRRKDYSCLHASQDGSFPWGTWPDEAYKPDEIGGHPTWGGAIRYIDPLTGSSTGTILDAQYDLATFAAHWARMEAWSVVYSAAAYQAANQDSFGSSLGLELASWLRPIAPHVRYTPGADLKPDCGPVVRTMNIPNARSFVAYTRWPIWGALEALIPDGGSRAAAGISVDAIRDDTAAVVASGLTDASGYVTLTPLPANGSRAYHLSY